MYCKMNVHNIIERLQIRYLNIIIQYDIIILGIIFNDNYAKKKRYFIWADQ